MPRTLYGKLALTFLGLTALTGSAYLVITLFAARGLVYEVNQDLNRDVARHLVSEILFIEEGVVNEEALEEAFHMIMVVNPSLEIYLLDTTGRIVAYSADPQKVKRERVSLDPIRRFLEGDAGLPILGDDPRDPERRKAFSAAAIGPGEGYLYVVLGGEQYDSIVAMLQKSYILRTSAAGVTAALLVAFVAGLLVFNLITRRLRSLSAAMVSFDRKGFSEPPASLPASRGEDEIDRLGSVFERMSRRMVDQLDEIKAADRLRRELVANVSHDLRTPLASLQGYLETLLLKADSLPPGQQRAYLEAAMKNGERLGRLVAALFELAKLEATEAPPHVEAFSLAELVQDVTQKLGIEAERRGIRLATEFATNLPPVRGDIGLIERVLENLLDNALRHTPEKGRVLVSLQRVDEGISVEVADTGQGIDREDLPRIFDRFYRAGKGVREGSQGVGGLGLAIVKRILELHGTRIDVASAAGAGARFSFCLPTHTA